MEQTYTSWNKFLSFCIIVLIVMSAWSILTIYFTAGFDILTWFCVACSIGALFLTWIRFYSSIKIKKIISTTLINLIVIEFFLQLIGWTNSFPSGIDVAVFSVPYGRIIKNAEGPKNSDTMNRYGWHYPGRELITDAKKIALIGDSFIEGLQIKASSNIGVVLENALNDHGKNGFQVFSFGIGGSGPAQYFEMLKHSVEYYGIQEAFIFIFLGNDLQNALLFRPNDKKEDPKLRIEYILDGNGKVSLNPKSHSAIERFNRRLLDNRKTMAINFPATAAAHLMTPSVLRVLLTNPRFSSERPPENGADPTTKDMIAFGLSTVNYKRFDDTNLVKAISLTEGILNECKQYCNSRGVKLRLVTIPWFSSEFYDQTDSTNWTASTDTYDFLYLERKLTEWSGKSGIEILAMGEYFKQKRMSTGEIRDLYFASGKGHWTVKGHVLFSGAIYDYFYAR